jgi:ribosome maturation factor RimP
MAAPVLESLVEDCLSKHGAHLIDLVIKNEGKGKSVEIYVDSEQGVTAEICSEISREVGGVIQSAGVVQNRLTVSSPGISRPLKFPWQYKKHVGRQLVLKVRSADGVSDVVGKMESVNDVELVIVSGKVPRSIAFDAIVDGRVKAPW